MDAKSKHQETAKYQTLSGGNQKNKDNFIVDFFKALWGFKAGLFMMGVSFCWYFHTFFIQQHLLGHILLL